MLNDKEFVKEVRSAFNLNLYEVKIWMALLSRGISTAGELSTIANIPRSRAYDILESLEKQGFILQKMGKPIKYVAVSPEDIIQKLQNQASIEAEKRKESLEKLRNASTMGKLSSLYTKGIEYVEPVDMSGLIKGRTNYHNQLSTMLKNAQKTVTIVTTGAGLTRKLGGLKTDMEKAKQRGVEIKILAPLNEENQKTIQEFGQLAVIQNTKETQGRFAIADGKDVVFMLMNDEEIHPMYDSGVWVTSPFFGQTLEKITKKP